MNSIFSDTRAAVKLALAVLGGGLVAPAAQAKPARVDRLTLRGADRTRESTVLALLPRRPPASYTDTELGELARRLRNLEIFDAVNVERRGTELVVTLREKWTLIPSVELSTARTIADSYALLGLTEYNFLGTGNQLGASAYREQRGWGAALVFNEHAYRRSAWAFGTEVSYGTVQLRFDDGTRWTNTAAEWSGWVTSPPWFDAHFNYSVGLAYGLDAASGVVGPVDPPTTHATGTFMVFTWDHYTWEDLVPHGFRIGTTLQAGLGLGPDVPLPRHGVESFAVFAVPLARYTVLTARAVGGALTRGSPNFSGLVGSVSGVRGLDDTFYRTWLGAVANAELRQALPLAERWALQGVLFADGAAFEQISATGGRGDRGSALSMGTGVRLVPTWLAAVVLRVDVARLLVPERRWFVQLGLSQYF